VDNGDYDLFEQMAAEGFVYYLPRPQKTERGAFVDLLRGFRAAFPDLNHTIEEQIVEGNAVVTRGIASGTHQAPLGDIPATGKRVELPYIMIFRFEGRVFTEGREVFDELGLMQQLGLIPGSE
jgi:predicted ester cyclase